MNAQLRTLFDKIWDDHVVAQEPGSPAVLYIDLHLVHEVTSPQAFQGLRDRGLKVHRPLQTVATIDHSVPTISLDLSSADDMAARQIAQLESNCQEFGIPLHGTHSPTRGIVHVIGPELGLTQPGMTIVCGDSHTATHGAFGALAFGIGTSEVEHVLATQCLLQNKPKTYQNEARPARRLTLEQDADVAAVRKRQKDERAVHQKNHRNLHDVLTGEEFTLFPFASSDALWRIHSLVTGSQAKHRHKYGIPQSWIDRKEPSEIV